MFSNKFFFCIPRIIVQFKAIYQTLNQGLVDIPDGPLMVLVCPTIVQMMIINEKILRGRQVEPLVNIDLHTKPSSIGIFFNIEDNSGMDLANSEIATLLSMTDPTHKSKFSAERLITTKVMFGNGVDLKDEELQIMIEGQKKYGKFNIVVGYDVDGDKAMFSVFNLKDPLIVEASEEFTTTRYEDYLASCLEKFRAE